jgi:nitrite reductase/ring-hydroxylating ferredoxin subunit/uncharacterized membrane protein
VTSIERPSLAERLERVEAVDPFVQRAVRVVTAALPRGAVKDVLHGVRLGHPLHPALTDLPLGLWTSALVLDLVGGKRARPGADVLVGIGVAAAVPTAVAGAADWSELNQPEQRTGLVHAVANLTATALFGLSFVARRRGRRAGGVALGLAGATAASLGGYLGGHLVFRRAAGVNHAADAPEPSEWTEIQTTGPLEEQVTLAELDGEPLAVANVDTGPVALYDRCSHLGGPLHEGDLVDGCARCPWHGSTFHMASGAVVHGPATAPQPAYELRIDGERVLARRRAPT